MPALARSFRDKSLRRDPWLLLLAMLAWLPAVWWPPTRGAAAFLGMILALALCKALAMPPVWRALVAPLSTLAALPWLGAGERPALAGALSGATGYLAFTLARRGLHAVRGWRYQMPDGRMDGWDYRRFLLARERLFSRMWPRRRRRILFPPTAMEAELRRAFELGGDRLTFAEPTAGNLREHDLVVPLTLEDLERLRAFGPLLDRNPLPLPDPACVGLCNDKLRFNRALIAAGFGECVPDISDALPFPYVLKKRIDAWGDNTHVVAGAEDERRLSALLHDPDYFRQAFVPGRREYATHLLVLDGRIAASLAVEYGFEQPLHKKCREQPPHYRRLRRATHLPLFRDMLRAIGYEGLCCVNYKLQDGRVRILEVNPRLGASFAPWCFVMVRALPRATRLRANATTSAASPTGA
jgi:hypothetical protein